MTVEGSKGNTYTISVSSKGAAQCSCPAHRFNRSEPCKHMLQALLLLETRKPPRHLSGVR